MGIGNGTFARGTALFLHLAEIIVEAVEAAFPIGAIMLDPRGDLLQRRGLDFAGAPLRVAGTGDETAPLENLEVLRDGGAADVQRADEFLHRSLAARKAREDRAARGIG